MERNHEDDGPTYALSAGAKRSVWRSRGPLRLGRLPFHCRSRDRWSFTLSAV